MDADDQETATDFTVLRNERTDGAAGYTSIKLTGVAVRMQVLKLREKFQDIIIDTGGRDTTSQRAALTVADLLLLPFVPRPFDVWTLENPALTFIGTPLGSRKAFSNAAAQGLAVTELRPADPKATDELMMLYGYAFDLNLTSQEAGQ